MKTLLLREELAQCVLGVILFSQLEFQWWLFPALLPTPDIGMLGYFYMGDIVILVGIILFSHSAFNRMLGYGLKYPDSFKNTHLGLIGKK